MTEQVLDNHINQEKPQQLNRKKQKLYVLLLFTVILIISHLPNFLGKFFLVDEALSSNDYMVFWILPLITLALALICPIITAKVKPELADFNITWVRKTRSEFIHFLLLPLCIFTASFVIVALANHLKMPITKPIYFYNKSITFMVGYVLILSIACPIVEEIFWRGYAQDNFSKVFGPQIAIFIQAVIFGLLHFWPLLGFLNTFLYGLIFGIWRYKRKTLLPIIIMHIIINSFYSVHFIQKHADLYKIKVKTNYVTQFNEFSKPVDYDPNENAAPFYQKAYDLYVKQPEQISQDLPSWPDDINDKKIISTKNWIMNNKDAIEQLKLGSEKPYFWPDYQGKLMFAIVFPKISNTRSMANALNYRAKLNATEDKLRDSFSDILICYRVGGHLTGRKTLIEQIVGISLKVLATITASQILNRTEHNSDLLTEFQYNLQTIAANQNQTVDLTSEKLFVYDMIQRMFTDDGKGDGYIPQIEVEQMKNPPPFFKEIFADLSKEQIQAWGKIKRRETTELTDRTFEYLNSVKEKKPAQFHKEGKDLQQVIEEMIEKNVFLHILMPASGKTIGVFHRCKSQTEALITTVAILRYKLDKDNLPNSLQDLVSAGFLNELPMDPYSDGPLIYKRLGDDFTLYSFGEDFDDDGGTPSEWGKGKAGGDQVFWPVQKEKSKD